MISRAMPTRRSKTYMEVPDGGQLMSIHELDKHINLGSPRIVHRASPMMIQRKKREHQAALEKAEKKLGHSKAKLVEPLDYETVIVKNKQALFNDPQREMLLFPQDDVSASVLPRRFRTVRCSVPDSATKEASSLFVKECIKSYMNDWNLVHYKYNAYSGTYQQLPRKTQDREALPEQTYEVDAEIDDKDEVMEADAIKKGSHSITKQGWLYKGPDSRHDTGIISFTRSFKRRYFYLKQQADTTYVLEFHKDDKKLESKGTIFLDSATSVVKSSKRGRNTLEINMQDKSFYLLGSDSEGEIDDWIRTLKKVVQSNENNNCDSSDKMKGDAAASDKNNPDLDYGTHPELAKYARETDSYLANLRQDSRQKVFRIYPDLPRPLPMADLDENDVDVFREQFGKRFIVSCQEFKTKLQANIAEDNEPEVLDNPEPFFLSLCLYDAREGKKISEDFHYDPNSPAVRKMIPREMLQANDQLNTVNGNTTEPDIHGLEDSWLLSCKKCVFSVIKPNPDIYLVCKIEKVLSSGITAATDPYVKNSDVRVGTKIHRLMQTSCNRVGHYRMPFGWAARPVFKPYSMEFDTSLEFTIYKQESSRVAEEELIKHLQDIRRPEKQGKWQVIPASFKVKVEPFDDAKSPISNILTPSLLPVRPFADPPEQPPTGEVEEFNPETGQTSFPFTAYGNSLYVYPKQLKYDSQKAFTKARNIACCIELRDSDSESTVPLKCIYGHACNSVFTTVASTAVLHHSCYPDFYEEVKMALPVQLNDKHHILFTFYHVSCDARPASRGSTNKRKEHIESVIGYAWLPLLSQGRVNVGEQHLSVAAVLPPGYLSYEPLGLGKGHSGPEIRWVDGAKQLFRCDLRLISTVYTKDPHLHNFFQHCQKTDGAPTPANDMETSNKLKSLLAVDVGTMINFLPTLINQLFRLLPQTNSEDVAMNTVKVLINVVAMVTEVGKQDILHSFVKYVFMTEPAPSPKHKTIHEELAKNLTSTLRPANTDHLVINKFLHHSWFFFEILIKSMAQHLLVTGRIKMSRNERFPSNYQYRVQTMVQTLLPHIMQRFKEVPKETQLANRSLANFIKSCFTFMDRGFVFRLINIYMDSFNIGDPKVLHEFKFDFLRIVCSHEHFIPLNLPMMKKGNVKSYKDIKKEDLKHDYTLSEEFRKNHFLVGLLLEECKSALNELPEIRKFAIHVLRNLLAKHSFDDRFSSKQQQSRIASLYLPLITLTLENINRLSPIEVKQTAPIPNGDVHPDTPDTPNKASTLPQHRSMISLPTAEGSVPQTSTNHRDKSNRDSNVFAMIAGSPSVSNVSISDPKPLQSSNSIHGSSTSLASNTSSIQSNMTNATDRNSEASERDKTSRTDSFKENGRPDSRLGQHHRRSLAMLLPDFACFSASNYEEIWEESIKDAETGRSQSMCGGPLVPRTDRLDAQEIKDLLVSFVYIVKNLSEEILLGWFNNSSEFDILDFFNVLDLCLFHFRYIGKNRIFALSRISDSSRKALTLPPKRAAQMYLHGGQRALSQYGDISEGGYHNPPEPAQPGPRSRLMRSSWTFSTTQSDADALYRTMLEANLASEIGMIALDVVSLYCNNFKEQLVYKFGDNSVMKKVFEIYLSFLATSQSQSLLKHAFAAMRAFIYKFPMVLYQGNATMCGELCYEILRCCNSRLRSTRSEACALMYMLMRSNFEFSGKSGFTRVHLQMIISVSQLISDVVGINGSRFSESLSIINSYANSDKVMQHTAFPVEVKDLTKRIRTVLMATAQMKEHENDPEMLIDLQYSLAKSYASTPELRKTWLDSMAKIHIKHDNQSEAAHCYLHVAALIAEYLKRRGTYPQGCTAFKKISPNIEPEESGIKDDTGMQDVQYTEDTLVEQLEQCARGFEKAERYEMLGEIYRLIIPIYEKKRDFQKLSDSYHTIHRSYDKVVEVMRSGRRLLGKYFRVAFFGQFFEEEDNKQYIYKEPRVTSLTEICDRLKKLFGEKFGKENVQLIMDSKKVNPRDLNAKYAYIQVTFVQPYFDEKELEERQTEFERSNNVRRFMYETPFMLNGGKARGEIEEQCKRRTILTTSHSFPYVKKRIMVVYHQEVELSPIEVAIDEIHSKTIDLNEIVLMAPPDMIKLQLKLQGSVSVQVNAGPMAYADAFLAPDKVSRYPKHKVDCLKDSYRQFIDVCHRALDLNATLIKSEQLEYQEAMRDNFRDIVMKLSQFFNEQLLPEVERPSLSHRASLTIFNVISTTPGTSTV